MNLFKEMFGDFFNSLSEKEKFIFNFISCNISHVSQMNIKELSLSLNLSEYSINKFCSKLNLDSYENLISILNECSKAELSNKNNMYNISKDLLNNFIQNLNETHINLISDFLFKYKEVSLLFSESYKIIAQYFEDKLKCLNIKTSITSSLKINSKNKDAPLIIYIVDSIRDIALRNSLERLSNKTIIVLSNTMIKNINNSASLFVFLPENKLMKTYNLNCSGNFFIFIDLIISKLIELVNIKN
ncbi:hypothetical protein SFBM_0520 [Candidatus Arthromitus sp. SFB-mouse-Japan]|uniref:MurR/RpiR family transcriptional regulator n=1 Tax=unclassified Candidatus Neoarthromitus TaxID=2638829 RepID=UPI00021B7F1C|nr:MULTISPECIES: hypothetical protein [unclassified Candidatus Arthromitus]EIA22712.1 Putative regulator [Candidatus Arthromitus sp. SFB-3]EIA23667.1 Putative regulator [Candidatus Arthromitus sp. SFB-2]EIA28543.1 Putative regulator [Candidatus Arthromitus sp. SFB-co]EIA30569.1 Putative regulator [Candidatus Arthromitus sp. SFB-mouse-SU]AID44467.1 Hypothetical protein SFBmNL_00559 [Candidatus Arthromitus sp. SFB-mouse-NL]